MVIKYRKVNIVFRIAQTVHYGKSLSIIRINHYLYEQNVIITETT